MAADKEPASKPGKLGDLKQLATLIAAVTALVTACTSLVKALDKSVEQASYETLSAHIVELQGDNAALHKTLDALKAEPAPSSSAAPSTSASAAAPSPSAAPPGPKPKSFTGEIPVSAKKCPVGDPLCDPGPSVPTFTPPPKPPLPPRPPMREPPSWGDVTYRANNKL